jgi:hypothetical protein
MLLNAAKCELRIMAHSYLLPLVILHLRPSLPASEFAEGIPNARFNINFLEERFAKTIFYEEGIESEAMRPNEPATFLAAKFAQSYCQIWCKRADQAALLG